MPNISLKAQNIVPLATLTAVQLLVVVMLAYESFSIDKLTSLQEASGIMVAIGALAGWLSYLMPADVKNALVFLRWNNALPGHRFIQLAECDARIDDEALRARIEDYESLRLDQKGQNSYWYREFYRPLVSREEVASTHKSYLLYRDAAAVSLIMAVLFATTKLVLDPNLLDVTFHSVWIFLSTALGCMMAGANAGRRLVTTAVAINLCK